MTFARYEKLDLIGRSHIGEVWRCLDSKHRRMVAALQLTDQLAEVSSWDQAWGNVLRYFREFRHEYVVQAIDTDADQRLILMELMADSMRSVLNQRERIQPDLVRRCLRRCLEALADLHPRGLIHSDIRPDQLLCNAEGRFRLSFSIGLRPGGVVIRRERFNEYFAPELLNPSAGPVGHQVDLYALGIAAYEMLVGTSRLRQIVPGVGDNAPEPQRQWMKWQADLGSELPRLSKIFGNAPPDLAAVIDGLVKKRTTDRFATADEALALLEAEGVVDDVLIPITDLPKGGPAAFSGPAAILTEGVVGSYKQGGPARPATAAVAAPTSDPTRPPVVQVGAPAPPPPARTVRRRRSWAKGWLLATAVLSVLVAGAAGYAWRIGLLDVPPRRSPGPRELSGTIDPPDARLTADGVPVPVSRGAWKWLAPDKAPVTLKAEHEKYDGWEKRIAARENVAGPIAITLKPSREGGPGPAAEAPAAETPAVREAPAVAEIPEAAPPTVAETVPALRLAGTVDPIDADVAVNGKSVDVSFGRWAWSSPEPTDVTIEARLDGFRNSTVSVASGNAPPESIDIVLDRLPALELTGTVMPPDAVVTIDGEAVPSEDGSWKWSSAEPREVTLAASRDGYESWTETFPPSGRHEIAVELQRTSALTLTGTLSPEDAVVTVNGEPVEAVRGRWTWSSLDPIEATVGATREGYEPWERTVGSEGRIDVAVELMRTPSMRLAGTLDPPDATLAVNGRPVEVTGGSWTWTSDDPVEVTLLARREGYAEKRERFDASGLPEEPIELTLEKLPVIELAGTLDPSDAELTINGEPVETADGAWEWSTTTEGEAVLAAQHPNFADWRSAVTKAGRSTVAVILDPLVSIDPADAAVAVDGREITVRDGMATLRIPPRRKVLVTLSRDADEEEFELTRESLAALGFTLVLPTAEPTPEPAVEPPSPLTIEFDAETARNAQAAWARSLGIEVFEENSIGMELALVPPGSFTIGLDPSARSRANAIAAQPAAVDRPFSVATTEVTQAQWVTVMRTRPWAPHGVAIGDDHPAVYVSWDDANEFCKRLTALEDSAEGSEAASPYRLPTEVEWEWACRAGCAGRFTCPDGEIEQYGWFERNVGVNADLHPVGQLERNRFGLFDVHGNAAEWCADVFVSHLDDDAPAPGKAILRGGGWNRTATYIGSTSRDAFPQDKQSSSSGFRVVRSR